MQKKGRRAVLLTVASATMALATAYGLRFHQWYRGETVFSPGFRLEAFRRVEVGMSFQAVEKALGKPLTVDESYVPETWLYFTPDNLDDLAVRASFGTRQTVISLKEPTVVFDASSLVESTQDLDGLSKPSVNAKLARVSAGDNKERVVAVLGEPYLMRPAGRVTFWRYSEPKNRDASFQMVWIMFSAGGRVVKKYDRFLAD